MRQYRWFHGSGLGDVIVNESQSDIKRTIGIPGAKIKPGRSYHDLEGVKVDISGFSSSEGGYLGIDPSGVFRVYDENGRCIVLPSGHANIDRVIKGENRPRNERFDLKI